MSRPNDEQAGSNFRLDAHAEGHGRVYQVGSGTQYNVEHHYHDDTGAGSGQLRPFDLPNLRRWIDRIAADYQQLVADNKVELSKKEATRHRKQLDTLRQSVSESSKQAGDKDVLRRLLAGGIAQYLSRADQLPAGPIPEHLILDVTVFALWPLLEAPKLPSPWQQDLAELTSPRVAGVMAMARDAKAARHPVSVEMLTRALSARPIASAVLNLFDDLADPGRGGAALTAIAIASKLPTPPRGGGAKAIATWISVALMGAAVGATANDIDVRVDALLDAMGPQAAGGNGDHHHGGGSALEHVLDEFFHHF